MKRYLTAVALPIALASCGGNLAPVAASLTPAIVSPEVVAGLRTWCARGAPLIAIAQGQNLSPQARQIADTVAPYCAALTAGTVPATTDGNTANWLPTNIAGLAQALGLSLR